MLPTPYILIITLPLRSQPVSLPYPYTFYCKTIIFFSDFEVVLLLSAMHEIRSLYTLPLISRRVKTDFFNKHTSVN